MAAKKFDVAGFIRGVQRPRRTVQLCTDVETRDRLDALMDELAELPDDTDESLMGNPRRDEVLAELRGITGDESVWTEFVVQAPTRTGRVTSIMTLAEAQKDDRPEAVLHAEAGLIADCVVSIAGNEVTLSVDDAVSMQRSWPDDLVQELVDAIRELGSDANSVPFSRRLSQTLETGTHSAS